MSTAVEVGIGLCDRCGCTLTGSDAAPDIAMLKLRGARLLLDKVGAVGATQERRTEGGLFMPVQTERTRRTYGIEGCVVIVGPDVTEDIRVGDRVIVDEFAGRPLWWGTSALPYWVVGEGEVMIVLRDAAHETDTRVSPA
jgi:co-chaperonin GroES (HSP10)